MVFNLDKRKCILCAGCVSVCPKLALSLKESIVCDESLCIKCLACEKVCPVNAIKILK